jgi:DNA primase
MKSKYGGPPFSRFGGRVVFPIIDPAARILGFGARILAGEGAKYVNSPETPVYHKSRVLFGLHQAKAAIRKLRAAVVVEGYMDVISLHQAGITNVLAASGTAFTLEQGRIIARQARSVTLLFDGDRAGLSAAARGADTLLATDLAISVCVLPEGHDPDSYVRAQGAEALGAYLSHPMSIWEFKLLALGGETVGPEDRIRLAGEIADSISHIPDELKREVYIKEMALKLDVDRNDLQKAVIGRVRRKTIRRESDAASEKITGELVDKTGLLAAILRYPDLARAFIRETGAKPFTHPAMRRVAEEMFRRMAEGMEVSPSALMNALDDPQAQQVIAAASVIELDEKTAAKYIADNLRSHTISELRAEHGELSQMIGKADARKKEELQKRKDEVKAKLDSLLGKTFWKPGR